MSGFLASTPTWDVLLCAMGFCFLIVCLVPCRLIHAAWRTAFLISLYVFMLGAISAGVVYGMGWATLIEPLAGFVQEANETIAALTGVGAETARPWTALILAAPAVLTCLVLVQVLCTGSRVRMFNRLLRPVNAPREKGRSDVLRFSDVKDRVPSQDDIQTAREGLGSMLRRSANPGKQSLAKWLQA